MRIEFMNRLQRATRWAISAVFLVANQLVVANEVFHFSTRISEPSQGETTIVFRLYPTDSGGTSAWTEQKRVKVRDGRVDVLLGTGEAYGRENRPLLEKLFANGSEQGWWIGLTVAGGASELKPRVRLASAPLAVLAHASHALVSPAGDRFDPFGTAVVRFGGALQSTGGAARGVDAVDLQVRRKDTNHVAGGLRSVISGGYDNMASGLQATVSGGIMNRALGKGVVIGGGGVNVATHNYSGVAAGTYNESLGDAAFVGGGKRNVVESAYGTIGGGSGNRIGDESGTISGGQGNAILPGGYRSAVGGGANNRSAGRFGTIGGGANNRIEANFGTVAGGHSNQVANVGASVAGGELNEARGMYATVSGGRFNQASGRHGFVAGGRNNVAGEDSLAAGTYANARHPGSFVWADRHEQKFSTTRSNQFLIRAGGGVGINTDSPAGSLHVKGATVLEGNLDARGTIAVSQTAQARQIVADSGVSVATSRSSAGVHLDSEKLDKNLNGITGLYSMMCSEVGSSDSRWDIVHQRGGKNLAFYHNGKPVMSLGSERGDLWYSHSDRRLKQDIESMPTGILEKLNELPVRRFRFTDAGNAQQKQTGFIAQEVKELFPEAVREIDGYLAVDYARFGVYSVAAIKELSHESDLLKRENGELKKTLADLLTRVESLERR